MVDLGLSVPVAGSQHHLSFCSSGSLLHFSPLLSYSQSSIFWAPLTVMISLEKYVFRHSWSGRCFFLFPRATVYRCADRDLDKVAWAKMGMEASGQCAPCPFHIESSAFYFPSPSLSFLIHYPCILVLVNGWSSVCFDVVIGPDLASRTPFMSVPLFFWHIFILFLCVWVLPSFFAKHKITDSSLPSLPQPWNQLLLQEALIPFSWRWYLEIETRHYAGS